VLINSRIVLLVHGLCVKILQAVSHVRHILGQMLLHSVKVQIPVDLCVFMFFLSFYFIFFLLHIIYMIVLFMGHAA